VEEQSYLSNTPDFTGEHGGEEKKVESVDPDEVVLVERLYDRVVEGLVDFGVGGPEGGLVATVAVDWGGGYVFGVWLIHRPGIGTG